MIKLKGTTIYPPAINDVLDNTPYVVNYVIVVQNSFAGTDEVIVKVGITTPQSFDVIKRPQRPFQVSYSGRLPS